MSKVISFSISDRYLEKLLSRYPELSPNLAAKQFLIEVLDADQPTIPESLDGSSFLENKLLDLEARIDSKLDDSLDAMEKRIFLIAKRVSILESKLDDGLDDKLPSNLDTNLDDSDLDALPLDLPEDSKSAIDTTSDNLLDGTETPVTGAVLDDSPQLELGLDTDGVSEIGEMVNASVANIRLEKLGVKVALRTLYNWLEAGAFPTNVRTGELTPKAKNVSKYLFLKDGRCYWKNPPTPQQP